MKKNSIYISGFSYSQLLWVLPIIKGLNSHKIETLIIEKSYGEELENYLNKYFLNSDIIYIRKKFFLYEFLLKIISIIFSLDKIYKFFILIYRKKIKLSWYDNQIAHSIWDAACSKMNDHQIKPNILQILLSTISSVISINQTDKINKIFKIRYAILGHSVYKYRAVIAGFRKKKIQIFCHANYVIYKQKKKDTNWSQYNINFFKKLKKVIDTKEVDRYWNLRKKGFSDYEDARIASRIRNKIKKYPKNVILLHIFKDSPFNYIDQNRIFYDYFEWISCTLKILEKSNEMWALRIHPNAKRWGENQLLILKNLININLKNKRNIIIDNNLVSNNFVFTNSKRIVTYSGTSHLESSCYGIKPIMICKSTLEALDKKYVLKPKNINEYENLLLGKQRKNFFKQDDDAIKASKRLLYIREKVVTLKNDLGGLNIYRGDSEQIKLMEKKNIEDNLKKNELFLQRIGKLLRSRISHTVSKKYYQKLKYKFYK